MYRVNKTKGPRTQHPTSHQDVEKGLHIAAVVKFGTRGIKELRDRFQISARLVQTLYDAFLEMGGVKPLLFICYQKEKVLFTQVYPSTSRHSS